MTRWILIRINGPGEVHFVASGSGNVGVEDSDVQRHALQGGKESIEITMKRAIRQR